jgi:hypothetical protein
MRRPDEENEALHNLEGTMCPLVLHGKPPRSPIREAVVCDLQSLITESHEKIIGHYRQLLASSNSEPDRERYRRSIKEHEKILQQLAS